MWRSRGPQWLQEPQDVPTKVQGAAQEQRHPICPQAQEWPEQTRISLASGLGPFWQHPVNSSREAVKKHLPGPDPEHRAQPGPPEALRKPAYWLLGSRTHKGGEQGWPWSLGCSLPVPRWPSGLSGKKTRLKGHSWERMSLPRELGPHGSHHSGLWGLSLLTHEMGGGGWC